MRSLWLLSLIIASGACFTLEANGKKNCSARLAALYMPGIPHEETIGYHGTGFGTLKVIEKTGILPAGSHGSTIGTLWFFPNLKHPLIQERIARGEFSADDKDIAPTGGAIKGAENYAALAGKDQAFLEHFGIPLTPESLRAAASVPDLGQTHDLSVEFFEQNYGLKRGKIIMAYQRIERERAQGVILGLGANVLDSFAVEKVNDEGLKLIVPTGLPLDFISGFEPVGQREYDYFEDLTLRYPPR